MARLNRTSGRYIVAGSLLVATAILAGNNLTLAGPLTPIQRMEESLGILDESDVKAPVDYGPGPGKKPNVEIAGTNLSSASSKLSSQIPLGGAAANITGVFGPAVTWPIIPIHVVLLPDGRVMNYGTNALGQQGAQLVYDVWDPSMGTGTNAHLVLPNTTHTDLFCGAQSVMLSGKVLTSGGDLTVSGVRNSANNNTTIFSPTANTLTENTPMTYARWYGSLVSLPNGQLAIFGGRQNVGPLSPAQPATTPELYHPGPNAWKPLTGATSTAAFGSGQWYYPRSYVAPGGNVFVLAPSGSMFFVSTAHAGSITRSTVTAPLGDVDLPTIPFAPGMALSVRMNQQVVVIDYRKPTPVVTPTSNIDQVRYWASGTILADGKVLITGGSQIANTSDRRCVSSANLGPRNWRMDGRSDCNQTALVPFKLDVVARCNGTDRRWRRSGPREQSQLGTLLSALFVRDKWDARRSAGNLCNRLDITQSWGYGEYNRWPHGYHLAPHLRSDGLGYAFQQFGSTLHRSQFCPGRRKCNSSIAKRYDDVSARVLHAVCIQ